MRIHLFLFWLRWICTGCFFQPRQQRLLWGLIQEKCGRVYVENAPAVSSWTTGPASPWRILPGEAPFVLFDATVAPFQCCVNIESKTQKKKRLLPREALLDSGGPSTPCLFPLLPLLPGPGPVFVRPDADERSTSDNLKPEVG